MTRVVAASLLGCFAAASACATKGQVRLLEGELRSLRVETARRDSIRAAALAAIITLEQRIIDSLGAGREALRTLDVRLQSDLTDVQRQLVQVQELTGQSQQRLTQLKAQIDTRAEQAEAAGLSLPGGRPDSAGGGRPSPAAPSADQMYQSARNQQTRGALGTARMGYQELLKTYPTHPLVPDALFYIGESFGSEAPDSAIAYYTQVVGRYKTSPRASTALFRMGRIEEVRRNTSAARTYFERLVREYPTSDDADLARERLKTLRP
jgi:TolA-binding protein